MSRFKQFVCPLCGRQFRAAAAVSQHHGDKHPDRPSAEPMIRPRRDDEPSMADLAVEAEIARAMGERSEHDWLLP